MEEESHVYPLAPARLHQRSTDEEFAATKPDLDLHKQKRSSKCFVYVLVAIVLHSIALLVFGIAVLRINSPKANLSSVSIKTLTYVTGQSPSFNPTMTCVMRVKNENFGSFKLENSFKVIVLYGNVTVGDMKIDRRSVRGRKTEHVNVTVQVRSSRELLGDESFRSDMNSGLLNLISYAKLRGEVHVMNFIKSP
ncbi:late embryogenesis abundant protein At1g64065-like [Cornus florida]|uniref:late embryogenesis abundant protein At1g64065-like n=1 Tax=Cornus florida TaxID=4283 RepID=UPI00289FA536|nr:late embryogenesis abundant protein At1g64065-like [Cornus florida]